MELNNVQMTKILPYLYLGNRADANNLNNLIENGIGYILNLTTSATEYPKETDIKSYHINILDSNNQCLKHTYQNAFDFIDEAKRSNSKVLIHCEAGISRSPTITVAYLIYKNKMEATDAYNFVRSKRPIVSPNINFISQLYELEKELIPDKVEIRLAREKLEAEENMKAEKIRKEKIKDEPIKQKPLTEKNIDNIDNKLATNKSNDKRSLKLTMTLNLESSNQIKSPKIAKNLSLDLKTPVLNNASFNKYLVPILKSNETINDDQNLENQELPNLNNIKSSTNIQKLNSPIVNSSIKLLDKFNKESIPKSTSQPQITSTNKPNLKRMDKSNSVDSNNNNSIDEPMICNDKINVQTNDKHFNKKIEKINIKIKHANFKLSITQATDNLPRSVPSSKATTPASNRQSTFLIQDLINNYRSISQNNLPINYNYNYNSSNSQTATIQHDLNQQHQQTKTQFKKIRPNSLFSANQRNKVYSIKHNALTPSSLCSSITAFAVSPSSLCSSITAFAVSPATIKSSPTLNTSHFEAIITNDTKRRLEKELADIKFLDLNSDFMIFNLKKKKTDLFGDSVESN